MKRFWYILICLVLICSVAVPALAADEVNNKYGYLNIDSITFVLTGTNAEVTIDYTIDPWIEFFVFLFGKEDLKIRVLAVANYPEIGRDQIVTFKSVDTDKTVITVSNAVMDYGDGSTYWFYQHEFGTTIPTLTFITSEESEKVFHNVKRMDKGFGFFQ